MVFVETPNMSQYQWTPDPTNPSNLVPTTTQANVNQPQVAAPVQAKPSVTQLQQQQPPPLTAAQHAKRF